MILLPEGDGAGREQPREALPWFAAVPGAVGDHGQLSLGLWVTWPPEALETGMSLQTLLWLWNLVPKGRVWVQDKQRGFGESKAV